MDPLAFLKKNLSSGELQTQLLAVKRLSTIAVAIGPESTKETLLPFLTEYVSTCHPEVGKDIATQLSDFSRFIGSNNIVLTFPCLEVLAAFDDAVVCEEAIETLVLISEDLQASEVETHLVPVIQKLSKKENFSPRKSAVALIARTYCLIENEEIQNSLRNTFSGLSEDPSPLVRSSVASQFAEFASNLDSEFGENYLLPILIRLSSEELELIQLYIPPACVAITPLLSKSVTKNTLFPLFQRYSHSNRWRVRCSILDSLVDFASRLDQDIVIEKLTVIYNQLSSQKTESEPEVRNVAANILVDFAKVLPTATIVDFIIPCAATLSNDESPLVRSGLSSVILGLPYLCGNSVTTEKLLPILLQILKDDVPKVHLGVLSYLDVLIDSIGPNIVADYFAPQVAILGTDPRWRVRLSVLESLSNFGKQLGLELFSKYFQDLCCSSLKDPVYAVREASIKLIKGAIPSFSVNWFEEKILPEITLLGSHEHYLHRMTSLFVVNEIYNSVPATFCQEKLLPIVFQLKDDPVPNIRFNVCKTLVLIYHKIAEPQLSEVKNSLTQFTEDSDTDVKYFANQGLISIA